MNRTPKTVVFWKVRCLNSQTKQYFDRELVLDSTELPVELQQLFVEISRSSQNDHKLVQFRPYFRQRTDDDFKKAEREATEIRMTSVHGYFEDEEEKVMDEIELLGRLTGQVNPIILGNSRSVTRLGPCAVKDKAAWTVAKANNIAHFLSLCIRLARGRWMKSEMTLHVSPETKLIFPDDEATDGALLAIRQFLEKRDDAFNWAYKHYLEHVSDPSKYVWMTGQKRLFDSARTSECYGLNDKITNEELVEIYAYGAKRLHRSPNNSDLPKKFSELQNKHGADKLMFAFGGACKSIFGPAGVAANVVAQDYRHWIEVDGCADSEDTPLAKLMKV